MQLEDFNAISQNDEQNDEQDENDNNNMQTSMNDEHDDLQPLLSNIKKSAKTVHQNNEIRFARNVGEKHLYQQNQSQRDETITGNVTLQKPRLTAKDRWRSAASLIVAKKILHRFG